MSGFDCTRSYGPHHGYRLCTTHMRAELWHNGRPLRWCAREALDDWRRYHGARWPFSRRAA